MIIGFTGTRTEPTWRQQKNLRKFVEDNHIDEVHHGACTGSDELMHQVALMCGIPSIVVHPPIKTVHMMTPDWNHDTVTVYPPKGYYERDVDIIIPSKPVDLLLAMPNTSRRPHSGTWTTVDIAVAAHVPVLLFWPDGQIGTNITNSVPSVVFWPDGRTTMAFADGGQVLVFSQSGE